jgi:uncharacterized membrane protein YoaK (UPF0700 family)
MNTENVLNHRGTAAAIRGRAAFLTAALEQPLAASLVQPALGSAPVALTSAIPKSRELAAVLAFTAGFLDAATFVSDDAFCAHITGNLLLVAARLPTGAPLNALASATLPVFVITVLSVGRIYRRMAEHCEQRALRAVLAYEAACVAYAYALLHTRSSSIGAVLCLVSAMAAQNVLQRMSPRLEIVTTVMTGILVQCLTDSRRSAWRAWCPATQVLTLFAVGGLLGALSTRTVGSNALVLPFVCLGWSALRARVLPRRLSPTHSGNESSSAISFALNAALEGTAQSASARPSAPRGSRFDAPPSPLASTRAAVSIRDDRESDALFVANCVQVARTKRGATAIRAPASAEHWQRHHVRLRASGNCLVGRDLAADGKLETRSKRTASTCPLRKGWRFTAVQARVTKPRACMRDEGEDSPGIKNRRAEARALPDRCRLALRSSPENGDMRRYDRGFQA